MGKLKALKSKWWIIALVVVAVIAVVVFRQNSGASTAQTGTVAFVKATVMRRDMKVTLTGTGSVTPNDSYLLTSRVKGDILEAPFEEGQVVEKGDLLYLIDAGDIENSIRQAEDSVRSAEDNVIRSQDSLVSAQQSVRNSELSLQNAQRNYDDIIKDRDKMREDIKVKSTVDGQITKLYYDVGDNVQTGAVIADVRDRSTMLLTTQFHSVDANNIYAGQSATVTMSATGETLGGTVDSVSAVEIVGAGGTLVREVKVSVHNPGGITESSFATAEIGGITCQSGGRFEYNVNKTITAKASGEVESVYLREGSYIVSEQVILQLKEPDSYEKQIHSATISLEQARISLQNANNSVKTSGDSIRTAQNGLETARRNLQTAQDSLDDYSITAPIRGTVIEKNYKVGDTYDASASNAKALTVIFDLSKLTFVMNVDELDVMKLIIGQKVTVTADALPGKFFSGFVSKININGSTINGVTTYPVTIEIDRSDELLPGMNISAEITIEDAKDILVVPAAAISRGNNVLKVVEGAAGNPELGIPVGYERVTVEVGRTDGNFIEILSGLEENDEIGFTPVVGVGGMSMFGGGMMGGGSAVGGQVVTVTRN